MGRAGRVCHCLLYTSTTRPNEYTIVKQFGKVVRVIDQPGLSLKTPFVQSTSTLPKTEMLYDLAASDVITSDKKSMVADSFVLWRIVDPLKFIQTLSGSVSGAEARLDQAVYNSLKKMCIRDSLIFSWRMAILSSKFYNFL